MGNQHEPQCLTLVSGPFASLLALRGFINPPMSRFTYHVKPSLQLV